MISDAQKLAFKRDQKNVRKKYPLACTKQHAGGYFYIDDGHGNCIIDYDGLLLPRATSVREAWRLAALNTWYVNMIQKSNAAFSDEKIFKKLIRESSDVE